MPRRLSSAADSPDLAARVDSVIETPPRNSVSKMSLPRASTTTTEMSASTPLKPSSAGRILIQSTVGSSAREIAGTTVGSIGSFFMPPLSSASNMARVTQMPVKSVVMTPIDMVRAKPLTSVAPTL